MFLHRQNNHKTSGICPVLLAHMRWPTLLTLALALAASALVMVSCTMAPQSPIASSQTSLYDKVIHSGKLRCGYLIYTPGCMKDLKTGKMTGVGPDILALAAKRLGLELVWTEEVGLVSMIDGLQTGRYDIVGSPIWANASRAKLVDFSKPIYYSPVSAYVKKGNNQFSVSVSGNINALNSEKVKIATMDGEMSSIIARTDFPKAKTLSLPQLSDISQILLTVASGKADVAFVDPVEAYRFIEHNPGSLENITRDRPLRVFGNTYMFRRGEAEFKDMLNTTIDELANSGEIDRVIAGYEPFPNAYFRVAYPYRSESQAQILIKDMPKTLPKTLPKAQPNAQPKLLPKTSLR